jgi:hypothetical protein
MTCVKVWSKRRGMGFREPGGGRNEALRGLLMRRTGAFQVGCGGCFDDATAVSKSWRRRCGSCGILVLRLQCRYVT